MDNFEHIPPRMLTATEQQLLAREVAADHHVIFGFHDDQYRKTFYAGWDAAMEYTRDRVRKAYEDAAIIAENCTQDNAARDEPFRIAQTIREVSKEKLTR